MSAQTEYSPDFQRFLQLVDKSLVEATADARELAERTAPPGRAREQRKPRPQRQTGNHGGKLPGSLPPVDVFCSCKFFSRDNFREKERQFIITVDC